MSELSAADIDAPDAQRGVRSIEHAVVHYGTTTLTFLDNLRQADGQDQAAADSYISAVTVEENTVVAYNTGYPCGAESSDPHCAKTSPPTTKLRSFYPKEGALFSDHPYLQLTSMDATKKSVAADFLNYLRSAPVQEQFTRLGFRHYTGTTTPLITEDNGALPDTPLPPLGVPSGAVLAKLLATWPELRKPANVLICLDTSGSMVQEDPTASRTNSPWSNPR
jgi:Ca-activated chloride channel homolog